MYFDDRAGKSTGDLAEGGVEAGYFKLVALWLTVLVGLMIVPYFFDAAFGEMYLSEGGPVQVLSAAGYVVVIVSIVRELGWEFARRHFYFVLFPLVMCLRELDFHAIFTPISMTKTSFFVAPEIPAAVKMVVIAIYLALGTSFVIMARRHFAAYLRGLAKMDPVTVSLTIAAALAVVSKTIDGPSRKLAAWGVELGGNTNFALVLAEEVLELGIPVFFAMAVFGYAERLRGKRLGAR